MKRILLFITAILFIGCGDIVENMQKGNIQDSIKIAKEMTKNEATKKYDGKYPLIVALDKNNLEVAKILINKGADINIKDSDGNTPLMLSLKKRYYNIAKMLILKGADVNVLNNNNNYPLDIIISDYISRKKNPDNIVFLLLKKGAKFNNNNDSIKLAVVTNQQQWINFFLKHFPNYKSTIVNEIYNSKQVNLYKFAIAHKLLNNLEIINVLENYPKLKNLVFNNYSKKKIFKLSLQQKKSSIIKMLLNTKIFLNKKELNKLINIYSKNNKILILIYKDYPTSRKMLFINSLKHKNTFMIKYALKIKFKLTKNLLSRITKLNLDYNTLKLIINNANHLKNTKSYKILVHKLQSEKIKKEWNDFVKLLNNNNKISSNIWLSKIGKSLKKLKRQNINKNIKRRAENMSYFLNNFLSLNDDQIVKKLKKLLLYKTFVTQDTMFLKSGPCLFGMCAGHNQATAHLDVILMKILNNTYGNFKIQNITIQRDFVSNWDAYNKVVDALRRKYEIGNVITKSIADVINENMWKIHTSGNRKGFTKKDLAFIGMYMSQAKAVANTIDTGNWLIFDNINCDAGILINRLEKLQFNDDVFDNSYKKMYKKCGWNNIR